MTAKSFTNVNGVMTKQPGWFSWRHRTRDAHDEARERYLSQRGPVARRERAEGRPPMPHGPERAARGCTCTVCRTGHGIAAA